jgi:malate dehydrogenase (oxaloacetate-decarboxylating)(NADP+)
MGHLNAKPTDPEHCINLVSLAHRNETLLFHILMSDPTRFLSIVYDPAVTDTCLVLGHIYRRA